MNRERENTRKDELIKISNAIISMTSNHMVLGSGNRAEHLEKTYMFSYYAEQKSCNISEIKYGYTFEEGTLSFQVKQAVNAFLKRSANCGERAFLGLKFFADLTARSTFIQNNQIQATFAILTSPADHAFIIIENAQGEKVFCDPWSNKTFVNIDDLKEQYILDVKKLADFGGNLSKKVDAPDFYRKLSKPYVSSSLSGMQALYNRQYKRNIERIEGINAQHYKVLVAKKDQIQHMKNEDIHPVSAINHREVIYLFDFFVMAENTPNGSNVFFNLPRSTYLQLLSKRAPKLT